VLATRVATRLLFAGVGAVTGTAYAETVATPVLKAMVEGMPSTEANIVSFDIDPGWQTDHHIHPGHVFVYVIEGAIQIDVDGHDPVALSAGDAIYELPNTGMVGRNASATERAKIVVFQFGEAGQPLTIAQ
jgi:quercetin dioxygenase-like cupin family protein